MTFIGQRHIPGPRTPWKHVRREMQGMDLDELRFYEPALRSLANFRDVVRLVEDALDTAKSSPLIHDQSLRVEIVRVLDATWIAIERHWNGDSCIIFNDTFSPERRRRKCIRQVKRSMRAISQLFGACLLDTGVRIQNLAQQICDRWNLGCSATEKIQIPAQRSMGIKLTTKDRAVAVLHGNPDFSMEEIAKAIGVSRPHIYKIAGFHSLWKAFKKAGGRQLMLGSKTDGSTEADDHREPTIDERIDAGELDD